MDLTLFVEFFRSHRFLLVMCLISLAVFPLQEVLLPDYYGKWVDSLGNGTEILRLTAIIAGLWILSCFIYLLYDYAQLQVSAKMESWVRKKTFADIFETMEEGNQPINRIELLSQLSKFPGFYVELFINLQETVLPSLVFLFILAIYLFLLDRRLFVAFAVGIVILFFLTLFFVPRILRLSYQRDVVQNGIMSFLDDLLVNAHTVFCNSGTKKEVGELHKSENEFQQVYIDQSLLLLYYRNLALLVSILLIFVILFLAYGRFVEGKIPKAKIIALFVIFTYWLTDLKRLYEHVNSWTYQQGNIDVTTQVIQDILKSIDPQKPLGGVETKTDTEGVPATVEPGTLWVRDLTFRYQDTVILDNISLDLPAKTTLVVHGKIGSGKSTLLRLLMGLETAEAGADIRVGGLRLTPETLLEWRETVGYVAQDAILFDRSLYENLVYGAPVPVPSQETVLQKLRQLSLDSDLPDLSHKVGKHGHRLSGGQRRLVLLFRSILSIKPVILVDEPTSNLDEKTSHLIYRVLELLSQTKTLLIVSHDRYLISRYPRIDVSDL